MRDILTAQQQEQPQGGHRWVFRGGELGRRTLERAFASQKMLSQELSGCTLFNPTDIEHCLLHHFIGVKKEHDGTQTFFFL